MTIKVEAGVATETTTKEGEMIKFVHEGRYYVVVEGAVYVHSPRRWKDRPGIPAGFVSAEEAQISAETIGEVARLAQSVRDGESVVLNSNVVPATRENRIAHLAERLDTLVDSGPPVGCSPADIARGERRLRAISRLQEELHELWRVAT